MNMSGVSSSFSNKNLLPSTTMSKNLDRPSAGDDDDGGGLGPTDNSGGANEAVGNIYLDNFAKGTTTNFLPFDIFSSSFSTIPCKSPEMVGNVRFPFTYAQRKELERQAMIYKYMICSVPVPPHLLLQLSTNFTDFSASSTYNGRYSRNGDPEPGRCKRTDGKKWRCSREAAPHQKYCERHLHRGRPRSRKPVEVKNNGDHHKKTRVDQTKSLPIDTSSQQIVAANEPPLLFNAKADLSVSTPSFKGDQRDFGLALEGKMEHHMMEAFSVHTSVSPILHQDYVEHHRQPPSSIFPYSTSPMPEVGFIDAWLINDMYKTNNRTSESSIPLNDINLSPSLNLPLAQNVELGRIQTENIVEDYDHEHKTNGSIWSGPISWESFGGPLGEALQPGSLVFGSNLNSPYNSISTPATTVSSPSGVLHRTLFSDGSVCNSPSFGASTSEVAIQWLN